jgi:DNA-binding MarR family transcriptional regulator
MPSAHPHGPSSKEEVEQLRRLVQQFVRRFGLLVTKQTPCGQPLSTSYAHALMVLLEQSPSGPGISQAELGSTLGIDKSNVARLCSRMVAAGHAIQVVASTDARSRLVTLTPPGKRLAERIDRASHERFGRIVGALPRARRAVVFESLAALNAAVETLPQSEAS